MSLTQIASVEEALNKKLSGLWLHVRFRRATNRKGFVLMNLHTSFIQAVCTKLFLQGCKLLSPPAIDTSGQFASLHFSASNETAGILALMFPCSLAADQLVISEKGKLLSGMAAKLALDPYVQGIADGAIEA